jgi:hypothetical protein
MDDKIRTTGEAHENDVLPRRREVHANPGATPSDSDLPAGMRQPVDRKSPAQWAYERLILYIQEFEAQLDSEHEVAMGFTGGEVGVLRIEGMGYFEPDIVTFYGTDPTGARTQQILHVSQLNVMLRALPKAPEDSTANRIGFRLARELGEA